MSTGSATLRAPSRTAIMVALARAGHLLQHGRDALVDDAYAWPLAGPDADAIRTEFRPVLADDEDPFLTWFSARCRLAEDWLADAASDQYVILGAGLDTFAWRRQGSVRVFEVDHPGSQAWKRARVAELAMPTPPGLTWVPVDLERDALGPALAEAGLDPAGTVFVNWLGVVPYLTREAILETLRQLPPCLLAISYVPPEEHRDADARRLGAIMEAAVAAMGEPFLTLLPPSGLAALLAEAGLEVLEDVGAHDVEPRYGVPALAYERIALARKGG
jgi:methyltransferase (TIGR00027 family)